MIIFFDSYLSNKSKFIVKVLARVLRKHPECVVLHFLTVSKYSKSSFIVSPNRHNVLRYCIVHTCRYSILDFYSKTGNITTGRTIYLVSVQDGPFFDWVLNRNGSVRCASVIQHVGCHILSLKWTDWLPDNIV